MTRSEMYAAIKENGWASEFQTKYGKNFTQGKTVELEEFIMAKKGSEYLKDTGDTKTSEDTKMTEKNEDMISKQAFIKLVTVLQSESCIDSDTAKEILDLM